MAIDKVTSASITDGTIATADIADGAVTSVKTTGVGGVNTPAFQAELSANQGIGYTGVWTKLDFDTEKYDLGSCYDPSSNQRFTPTTAGKYICYLTIMLSSTNNDFTQTNLSAALYKNGSGVYETHTLISGALWKNRTLNVTAGIDFNGSSDYLEAYGMADSTTAGSTNARGGILGSFGAYKIIQ